MAMAGDVNVRAGSEWWKDGELYYGGDYNPEQWPENVWQEDVQLMKEAKVNLVTVGVFSWARLEPAPGEFRFEWLRKVLDMLHGAGIGVDLATATASPPAWMAYEHPESLPMDANGARMWPGARQQYCPSSPIYRQLAVRLAKMLAEAFGDHPALRMWHVNNEYGCHVAQCYCDVSAEAFRTWLGKRYGTIGELNDAWGTAFWSQGYRDWREVWPPRKAPTFQNPSQLLDFARFSSDALLQCFRAEVAELRSATPALPVTTNFMGFFKPLNYFRWAEHEDLASTDNYPDPSDDEWPMRAAAHYDLVRSLKRGHPWLLMEQVSTRVNWRERNVAKAPGAMRLGSLQAVARGSNGAMFFQWRASLAGAEKFHGAMVAHAGREAPSWADVVELGAELASLGEISGSTVQATAGIVFDWENWWALELPAKPANDLRMLEQVEWVYRALYRRNLTTDFVPPLAELDPYQLVIVPSMYLLREETAKRLADYVTAGGTVVVSFWSGIVDEADHVRPGPYGSILNKVTGVKVVEVSPPSTGVHECVEFSSGVRATGALWSDVIVADGADVIAKFTTGPLAGGPAVTRHRLGKGEAFYIGTRLDAAGLDAVMDAAVSCSGAKPAIGSKIPQGVEVVVRQSDQRRYLFAFNHSGETMRVSLGSYWSLVVGGDSVDSLALDAGDVVVARQDRS